MSNVWPDTISNVLSLVGYLGGFAVVLAGIAAFAYWLFRLFAEKWLSSKFDKQMESHRHAQARELEELRFNIQGLLDRTLKLHQREFDVLPKAWELMVEAYGKTQWFTSPLQTYPDLSRMNKAQLDEFLNDSPLTQWQKDELDASSERIKYYQGAIFWHRLYETNQSVREFNLYFWKSRIFMPKDLQAKFTELHKLMSDAIFERQMNEEMKGTKPERTVQKKFRDDGDNLRDALESAVYSRLWDAKA